MELRSKIIAAIDHQDLEQKLNTWLLTDKPQLVFPPSYIANGSEYVYSVLLVYENRERKTTGKRRE